MPLSEWTYLNTVYKDWTSADGDVRELAVWNLKIQSMIQ